MGDLGIQVIHDNISNLKKEYHPDFIIAQAENVDNGKGISLTKYQVLRKLGIDFFTGGNWSTYNHEIYPILNDPLQPIIRPANMPADTLGLGYKYLKVNSSNILIISILGKIVGRDAELQTTNPLKAIDSILTKEENIPKNAVIVNYHGDYSSEKVVFGHYLDGRVTAVIGDHWHVPTSDARILSKGTAHITDVGMNGSLDSSLGVKLSIIYKRWRDDLKLKNELESNGKLQFNALLVDFDPNSMLASNVVHIQKYY